MKILGILLLIISIEEILVKSGCDPSVSDCKKCYYSLSCYTCNKGF